MSTLKAAQQAWAQEIRRQGRDPYEQFAVATFKPSQNRSETWKGALGKSAKAWAYARKRGWDACYVTPNPFTGGDDA